MTEMSGFRNQERRNQENMGDFWGSIAVHFMKHHYILRIRGWLRQQKTST